MFNANILQKGRSVVGRFPLSSNGANAGDTSLSCINVGTVPFTVSQNSRLGFYEVGPFSATDYFSLPTAFKTKWQNQSKWMVDFWVNTPVANGEVFFSWTNENGNLNLIQVIAGPILRVFTNGIGSLWDSPAIPNLLNNWFFIRLVCDGNNRRLYYGQNINNMTRITNSLASANTGTIGTNQFDIGRLGGGAPQPHLGKLKNMRFSLDISNETNFTQN